MANDIIMNSEDWNNQYRGIEQESKEVHASDKVVDGEEITNVNTVLQSQV